MSMWRPYSIEGDRVRYHCAEKPVYVAKNVPREHGEHLVYAANMLWQVKLVGFVVVMCAVCAALAYAAGRSGL